MWHGITPSPDPGFVRKLRDYDPKLRAEFRREYGKFAITQPAAVGPNTIIFLVEGGENGRHFRQPDARDLAILHHADMARSGNSPKDRMYEGEAAIADIHRKQEAKVRSDLRDATKDGKYQLMRTFQEAANTGKGTRPFRQITHKPKGKVFK